MSERGIPARDLSDQELERQGAQAHLTRNRVFLHGTAEQFRYHTERMLELEQEYLNRHPKRTWQGSEDRPGEESPDLSERNTLAQIRTLFKSFVDQRAGTLDNRSAELLARFAASPDGRMHKLEAHQAARKLGLGPAELAALYKHEPPLLATAGQDRVITDDGRKWLQEQ
jgi:hypothetical protein